VRVFEKRINILGGGTPETKNSFWVGTPKAKNLSEEIHPKQKILFGLGEECVCGVYVRVGVGEGEGWYTRSDFSLEVGEEVVHPKRETHPNKATQSDMVGW